MAFKLESFTEEVIKEIAKSELKSRKMALKHAAKVMRKNISMRGFSTPGGYPTRNTGNLRKSIGFKLIMGVPGTSLVGSKAPHAHLVEFGHGDGKTKNKRPFVSKTLLTEEQTIIEILSTEY